MFKIRLPNSKIINNNSDIQIDSKRNGSNNNSNSGYKKFKKKLINSKIRNLTKSKNIARNSTIKIK